MAGPNVITTDAHIGRRREARLRVRLESRLITLDGTIRAVLADVSSNGAKVQGDFAGCRPGQEAVLQWDGYEAFGVIVWATAGLCGICFYDPIGDQAVSRTRRIDEVGHLPPEHELARHTARAFVQGKVRL